MYEPLAVDVRVIDGVLTSLVQPANIAMCPAVALPMSHAMSLASVIILHPSNIDAHPLVHAVTFDVVAVNDGADVMFSQFWNMYWQFWRTPLAPVSANVVPIVGGANIDLQFLNIA